MQSCNIDPTDLAGRARGALERVCSGRGLDPASRYYSARFVDHVNDLEFRGHDGIRQSLALYASVLTDITITVEEQIVDGDRVSSRFVVTGKSGRRSVRFNGITNSRFEDGQIVEDWSVTDTLGLLRQLGAWRTVRAGLRHWWSARGARPTAVDRTA